MKISVIHLLKLNYNMLHIQNSCCISYCLTLVQPVQSGDVILAHLSSCAKFNIGIGNGLHGGLVVAREGIPGIMYSGFVCIQGKMRNYCFITEMVSVALIGKTKRKEQVKVCQLALIKRMMSSYFLYSESLRAGKRCLHFFQRAEKPLINFA